MRYLYLPPCLPLVKPCVSRPHSAPAQGWEGGKSRQIVLRQRWRLLSFFQCKNWTKEGKELSCNPRSTELLLFSGVLVQKVRSFLKLRGKASARLIGNLLGQSNPGRYSSEARRSPAVPDRGACDRHPLRTPCGALAPTHPLSCVSFSRRLLD